MGPVDRVFVGRKLKELIRKRDSDRPRDPNCPALVTGRGERHRAEGDIHHRVARTQLGSVVQSVKRMQCGMGAWKNRHLGTSRDSSFGRDTPVFTVERSHNIRGSVLCRRFES